MGGSHRSSYSPALHLRDRVSFPEKDLQTHASQVRYHEENERSLQQKR